MSKNLLVTLEFPPQIGGTQKYYQNLCSAYGANQIVVLTPPALNAKLFDQTQAYKIIRHKFFGLIWPRWFKLSRTIQKVVQTENIDYILAGQIIPVGSAVLLAKKPFAVFLHGKDIGILSGRKKILAQEILNKADKIFVNSNFTKSLLLQKFKAAENKIQVNHPVVRVDAQVERQARALTQKLIQQYNLGGKKIILTIARLVERKGHGYLIEALARLKENFPNLIYVIVGTGPYRDELTAKSKRLGVSEQIIFTGSVSEVEMNAWLQVCDIFAMTPTQNSQDVEGFGIVYLEAKHYQKPIIAAASGGVKEAIGKYSKAIYVNPDNVGSIPNAIKTLCQK
ncbi:MAG: hypothetical protein COT81_03200 [Candidatus Buchananbacteria bacterium CG10_big_fil_rev_8_21_14_0_10_42_9]|uniref:Glycosyltransferase family 1 protein n=1 Tax=Candidatus Buchananbacteria bacterium CG10_big_fil_rev_8_21_14_0_10_42_9 TaxID=1974526 RepID=A0A2H0W163_9BACT|nr:MAG: hypothetical protein COT81_03200 [Candidatus Buchananbacteria bacterium CG10_big_fil_rev_8_21_14_0_10_42_9]